MVGHGRKDGGADWVEGVDAAEVTNDRQRPLTLGEVIE
jgi:hypothetical protein